MSSLTRHLERLPVPNAIASDADRLSLARTIATTARIVTPHEPRHQHAFTSLVSANREAQARKGRPFVGRHLDMASYRALPTVPADPEGMSS